MAARLPTVPAVRRNGFQTDARPPPAVGDHEAGAVICGRQEAATGRT